MLAVFRAFNCYVIEESGICRFVIVCEIAARRVYFLRAMTGCICCAAAYVRSEAARSLLFPEPFDQCKHE